MASVWYIGPSDSYTISSLDWAANGITADQVVWDKFNGFSVPKVNFTSAQLSVLSKQNRFNTSAPDGPRNPVVFPTPSPDLSVNGLWVTFQALEAKLAQQYSSVKTRGGTRRTIESLLTCDLVTGEGPDQAPIINGLIASGLFGTVDLPAGNIPLDTMLSVLKNVGLVGAGNGKLMPGTRFVLRTPQAKVRVGTLAESAHRGPLTGHFGIDGQGIAEVGLEVGHVSQRVFGPMDVYDCKRGVFLNGTQNTTWAPLKVSDCDESLVLDRGSSRNTFTAVELNKAKLWNLRFLKSGGSDNVGTIVTGLPANGVPDVPSSNVLYQVTMENPTATQAGHVDHQAGFRNKLSTGGLFAAGAFETAEVSVGFVMVSMTRATAPNAAGNSVLQQSYDLSIDDMNLQGTDGKTTAFKLANGTRLRLLNSPSASNHLNLFDWEVGARILGEVDFNAVTNEYVGTGNKNVSRTVTRRMPQTSQAPLSSDVLQRYLVDGDTQARLAFTADGRVLFGPGNASQDLVVRRSAAGEFEVDGPTRLAGTFAKPVVVGGIYRWVEAGVSYSKSSQPVTPTDGTPDVTSAGMLATIGQRTRETLVYSVKDFGAIGDGGVHPLSERYSSLAAAQAVYPFATTLAWPIDMCAIQAAHDALASAGKKGTVWIPEGNYAIDGLLVSGGRRIGIVVWGDGIIFDGTGGLFQSRPMPGIQKLIPFCLTGSSKLDRVDPLKTANRDINLPVYDMEPVTRGATTVTFKTPSHAGNFAPGDDIYLRSADFNNGYNTAGVREIGNATPNAEFNMVKSADSVTGVVTLMWPAIKGYVQEYVPAVGLESSTVDTGNGTVPLGASNATAIVVRGIKVRNLRMHFGVADSQYLVYISGATDVEVTGLQVTSFGAGIAGGRSYRTFKHNHNVARRPLGGDDDTDNNWFGPSTGCSDGEIGYNTCYGEEARKLHLHEAIVRIYVHDNTFRSKSHTLTRAISLVSVRLRSEVVVERNHWVGAFLGSGDLVTVTSGAALTMRSNRFETAPGRYPVSLTDAGSSLRMSDNVFPSSALALWPTTPVAGAGLPALTSRNNINCPWDEVTAPKIASDLALLDTRVTALGSPERFISQQSDSAPVINSSILIESLALKLENLSAGSYTFEGEIHYASATNADMRLAFLIQSLGTGHWAADGPVGAATTSNTNVTRARQNYNLFQVMGGAGDSTFVTAFPRGFFTLTAPGSIVLQYAQDTPQATSLVIGASSWLAVKKRS